VAAHPVTAAFASAGAPPILADREALAATVAALGGEDGESMARATRRAEERAGQLAAQAMASGRKGSARRLIATVGLDAVGEAITRYRAGGQFATHDDAAWLSVTLRDLRVRDDAWARMDPEHREAHWRLWTDLTRLARPGYVAAPASLLAFTAWQSGNGALANIALDRALADDPRYSMAGLLRQAIDAGAPPRLAKLPMSPEEVAASYEHEESEYDDPGQDAGDATPDEDDEQEEGEDEPGTDCGWRDDAGDGAPQDSTAEDSHCAAPVTVDVTVVT
jgi:hypothetical protein